MNRPSISACFPAYNDADAPNPPTAANGLPSATIVFAAAAPSRPAPVAEQRR